MIQTVRFRIDGRVQGVGFRYWTVGQARALKLNGTVRNLSNGSVEVVAQGPQKIVDQLIAVCKTGPVSARVSGISVLDQQEGDPQNLTNAGFSGVR